MKYCEFRVKVSRLESLTGKERCPGCRLTQRHRWPDPATRDRSCVVNRRCKLCGRGTPYDLSPYPVDQHEMLRLYFEATLEEEYTHVRVFAAKVWFSYLLKARRIQRRERRREARQREAELSANERRMAERERRSSPRLKLLTRLRDERRTAMGRKRIRMEEKYGRAPFGQVHVRILRATSELLSTLKGYAPKALNDAIGMQGLTRRAFLMRDAEVLEYLPLLNCAEAERVVLGHVTASTAAQLAEWDGALQDMIDFIERSLEEKRLKDEEERLQQEVEERSSPLIEDEAGEGRADPMPSTTKAAPNGASPQSHRPDLYTGTLAHGQRMHAAMLRREGRTAPPPPAPVRHDPPKPQRPTRVNWRALR
jgi:hypothetical protein